MSRVKTLHITFAVLFGIFFTLTDLAMADSPLPGIVEYKQLVVVKCASNEEAKKISLKPMKLPNKATAAFSARWDDCNLQHLKTHSIMAKNGIKGTFYLNGWGNSKYGPEYCKKLIADGCSIGAHTRTHKSLPSLNPNELFYEIMSVRIMRESDIDMPVSTMVLPFCRFGNSGDKQIQRDIGQAMMNSGFVGAPEIYYGKYAGYIGYPKNTLAETALIRAGDRNVNEEKYRSSVKKFLGLGEKFDDNPCIAVAMHSWHTSSGKKTLDKLLAESSGNKDWWYCNQNEYSAYRFEVNNCSVEKKVKGNVASFMITRFTPESLGANVDLWFRVDGAGQATEISEPENAVLDSGALQLPHSVNQKIPSVIAVTDSEGVTSKIPFVKCLFKVDDLVNPNVKIVNSGSAPLEDIVFTLRSGPGFTPGVVVRKSDTVAAETDVTISGKLKHTDSPRYNLGKPYYVVQLDFSVNGKRYRLYSEYRDENKEQPIVAGSVIRGYVNLGKDIDYAKISNPSSSLKDFGLTEIETKSPLTLSKDLISFTAPKEVEQKLTEGAVAVAVLDFKPEEAGNIYLNTKADDMFLNGEQLKKDKRKRWVLPAKKGRNRLAIIMKYDKSHKLGDRFLFTHGVEFKEFCAIKH